jgi:hypothetical protein
MKLELDFATNDGLSTLFDRQPLKVGLSKRAADDSLELRLEQYDEGAGFGFGEVAIVALTFAGSVLGKAAMDAAAEIIKQKIIEMFQFGQGLVIRKIKDEYGNSYDFNEEGLKKLAIEFVKYVDKKQGKPNRQ